jgi:hypothetical protein
MTPISWLRLERHHLGEGGEHDERAVVAEHLRSCSECAALLARIVEDDARVLPPLALPSASTSATPARAVVVTGPWYRTPRTLTIAATLAVAAVVLLAIGRQPRVPDDETPVSARMKGSDSSALSFALVREDEAVIAEAGGSYRDGERFKAVLTCPPGLRASFDVAVFEHGVASFPLPPSADLACGNSVALPGAFRVTGHERMTVCLIWQPEGAIDREAIRTTPPDLLPHTLCKTLDPSP